MLIRKLSILGGLNDNVLKIVGFVLNVFYISTIIKQSWNQWSNVEQMIEGYFKVTITSLVGWTIIFTTGYVGFVDTTNLTNFFFWLWQVLADQLIT